MLFYIKYFICALLRLIYNSQSVNANRPMNNNIIKGYGTIRNLNTGDHYFKTIKYNKITFAAN